MTLAEQVRDLGHAKYFDFAKGNLRVWRSSRDIPHYFALRLGHGGGGWSLFLCADGKWRTVWEAMALDNSHRFGDAESLLDVLYPALIELGLD